MNWRLFVSATSILLAGACSASVIYPKAALLEAIAKADVVVHISLGLRRSITGVSTRRPRREASLRSLCVMLALFSVVATSSRVAADSAGNGAIDRDTAVFRAVLENEVCKHRDNSYQIISDRPTPVTNAKVPQTWNSSAALSEELAHRSEGTSRWAHVEVCSAARIVANHEIETAFAADDRIPPGWDLFKDAFPGAGALIAVSLPAFAPDGESAVVYLVTKCGVLCGAGFYIELKRTPAGWRVMRRETAWIS